MPPKTADAADAFSSPRLEKLISISPCWVILFVETSSYTEPPRWRHPASRNALLQRMPRTATARAAECSRIARESRSQPAAARKSTVCEQFDVSTCTTDTKYIP